MISFPFNENRFSFFFFVADRLLVDQLCTNPKSDRSLLSCLKVTQSSTSEIGDAPLYILWFFSDEKNFCQDEVHNSQNHRWIATNNRDVPRVKKKFPATVMVFGAVSSEGHIMPPYIFEVGLKVNTKVHLDVLKSVVIPWCNQVAGGRPWCGSRTRRRPISPKRPRLGFRRRATTLYPSLTVPLLPWPEPAGLLRLVIRREHHQHDLPQHQSQPDRRHQPSIRRAPTGACGKGMLPVLDPYRGGHWGWRPLHWRDVSCTT